MVLVLSFVVPYLFLSERIGLLVLLAHKAARHTNKGETVVVALP
jgi:hypothetical protein